MGDQKGVTNYRAFLRSDSAIETKVKGVQAKAETLKS
jgi:hypothetical protein